MGQKYLFELRKCSSYEGTNSRGLLMRIYYEIFTVPEESFELRTGSSNRKQVIGSLLYVLRPWMYLHHKRKSIPEETICHILIKP